MADEEVETRIVGRANLSVCKEGHVVSSSKRKESAAQLKHKCGRWTWADGNYCVWCGESIRT